MHNKLLHVIWNSFPPRLAYLKHAPTLREVIIKLQPSMAIAVSIKNRKDLRQKFWMVVIKTRTKPLKKVRVRDLGIAHVGKNALFAKSNNFGQLIIAFVRA